MHRIHNSLMRNCKMLVTHLTRRPWQTSTLLRTIVPLLLPPPLLLLPLAPLLLLL